MTWSGRDAQWLPDLLGEQDRWEGLPVLTPATWRRLDCLCGDCPCCRYFVHLAINAHIDPYSDPPKGRPSPDRPMWPTVEAALESYVRHIEDGYPVPAMGAVLISLAETGIAVRGGPPKSSPAHLAAEQVAAMDQALERVYPYPEHALTPVQLREVLFARVVGRMRVTKDGWGNLWRIAEKVPAEELAERYAIRRTVVASVVRSGMHRLRVQLAARGLTHMPPRSTRAYQAAATLREDLAARG